MQEAEPAHFTCGNEQHTAQELQDMPLGLKQGGLRDCPYKRRINQRERGGKKFNIPSKK